MAAIYRGSLLNIAAACSYDHAEGFFHPFAKQRRPLYIQSNLSMGVMTIRYDIPFGPLKGSALDSRGWILQEKTLSVRTVQFDQNNCGFTCSRKDNAFIKAALALRTQKKDETHLQHDAYAQWRDIVQEYSRRALTKKSDKAGCRRRGCAISG